MFLDFWGEKQRSLGLTRAHPLLCTLSGRRIQPSYVRGMLKRLALRAGLDKRVHPHGLRLSLAAELVSEGVPLNLIQAHFGHSNASTTSRYLQHIAPQQLVDSMRKRSWLEDENPGRGPT